MGRKANRKWLKRSKKYREAQTLTEKLRLERLFSAHRKFKAA